MTTKADEFIADEYASTKIQIIKEYEAYVDGGELFSTGELYPKTKAFMASIGEGDDTSHFLQYMRMIVMACYRHFAMIHLQDLETL